MLWVGPGPWAAAVSFKSSSSRCDKLKINQDYGKYRHFLMNYRRFDARKCDICEAEVDDLIEAQYGPIWIYLWEKVWSVRFTLFKQKTVKRTGTSLAGQKEMLTPDLLAFFDACVATAPWSDCILEGEKRTGIAARMPRLVEEHELDTAANNRDSLFAALA